MPSELKRLRQLEEDISKLKRLVADLSLDIAMLLDVLQESSEACDVLPGVYPFIG
jgi:putative transposase